MSDAGGGTGGASTPVRAAAVIPARFASQRLPGKMLLSETGKPLIQHVWEAVTRAQRLSPVIIATDDARIADAATGFGAQVVMTRADHPSGTDRVAEVASALDADIVVNVQGDEPELNPDDLDALVVRMATQGDDMATLARPLAADEADVLADPNAVKVVFDDRQRALYFSRSPIPHGDDPLGAHLHLGVYAYRREVLLRLAELPPVELERRERLEQLRALTHGFSIGVVLSEHRGLGIDTPDDYARFVARARGLTT